MIKPRYRAWDKNHNRMVYEGDKSNPTQWNRSYGTIIDSFEDEDLMQFTGQTDKIGKEIYVGDIAKMQCYTSKGGKNGCAYRVIEQRTNGAFVATRHKGNGCYVESCAKDIEVVGNIRENKDLYNKLRIGKESST